MVLQRLANTWRLGKNLADYSKVGFPSPTSEWTKKWREALNLYETFGCKNHWDTNWIIFLRLNQNCITLEHHKSYLIGLPKVSEELNINATRTFTFWVLLSQVFLLYMYLLKCSVQEGHCNKMLWKKENTTDICIGNRFALWDIVSKVLLHYSCWRLNSVRLPPCLFKG